MTGIVGSGFGLYGYLPAVVSSTDERVALFSNKKEIFDHRPELKSCESRISWMDKEEDFYSSIDTVILSVPPAIQEQIVDKISDRKNIQHFFLEKPVGISPVRSEEILTKLKKTEKSVRIGYIFQFTDWAKRLHEIVKESDSNVAINIQWSFKAHHYKTGLDTWKRKNAEGGSVIRFYGIQLIALFSKLGYSKVSLSSSSQVAKDEFSRWTAEFIHGNGSVLNVVVDSNSEEPGFNIETRKKAIVHNLISLPDPFGGLSNTGVDKRVDYLGELISSAKNSADDFMMADSYFSINKLWDEVERINKIEILS